MNAGKDPVPVAIGEEIPRSRRLAPLIPSSRAKVPPGKYHLGHSTLGRSEIWTLGHTDTKTQGGSVKK